MVGGIMSEGEATSIVKLDAPFGQKIEILDVDVGGEGRLLRLRIREGSRFTVFDIDAATAKQWGAAMSDWAAKHGDGEK